MAAVLSPLAALALLVGAAGADVSQPRTAVITIESPRSLAGNYPGRFAPSSALPSSPAGGWWTFVPPADPSGCSPFSIPGIAGGRAAAAVLRPGNCTAAEQAARAREAGAQTILLVSINETIIAPDLGTSEKLASLLDGAVVLSIRKSLGDSIAGWNEAGGSDPVRLSLALYRPPGLLDVSNFLMICLATSLVALGAFFATADLRLGSPLAPKAAEVVEIDKSFPFLFCVTGSCALVVFYFLMKYLIYCIIFAFCVGGATCITEFVHAILRYRFPSLQRGAVALPLVGVIERAQVIAIALASAIVTAWFLLRNTSHGWLFQDIIGTGFLCFLQRTLRLPSIKVAALLLSIMFCFDIFWVFISPLFFSQSVMVVVATGGGTGETVPMLLRIPAIGDALGRDHMLGFGDIALPGLLVSFLRRHDLLSRRELRRGYFAPAVVGYAVALCATVVSLYLMQRGQPALLYLVPGTLGTTLVIAGCRGELRCLWDGVPSGTQGARGPDRGTCTHCPSGHPLQPWVAESGACDGCRKPVQAGEQVMDCRQCNWYVCAACQPATLLPLAEAA